VLTIVTNFLIDIPDHSCQSQILLKIIITVILIMTVVIALLFLKVLKSERDANIRYRTRINYIRGIFLSDCNDQKILDYLSRKDLGNLTDKDRQPSGLGRTLTGVFWYFGVSILIILIFVVITWLL